MTRSADQAAHAGFAELLGRVGRVRGAAATMFAAGGLLLCWRVLFLPTGGPIAPIADWGPRAALSVLLNLCLVETIARWFAHVPKRHCRDAPQHLPTLRRLSQRFGVSTPRLVVNRDTQAFYVRLRGWGPSTALVISSPTDTKWKKAENTREAHIAHELGHLWARDLPLYFRIRSMGTISISLLALLTTTSLIQDGLQQAELAAKVAVLGIFVFITARVFLRFREHVADIAASFVLDDVAGLRSALPDTPDQSHMSRILRTHPTVRARRGALFNPLLPMKEARTTFLMLGLGAGFLMTAVALFSRPVLAGLGLTQRGPAGLWPAIITASALAVVLASSMFEITITHFSLRRAASSLIILFTGTATGACLLDPFRPILSINVTTTGLLLTAAVMLGATFCVTITMLAIMLTADEGEPVTHWRTVLGLALFTTTSAVLIAIQTLLLQ